MRYIAKKMRQAELESETLESSREEAGGANNAHDTFVARFRLPRFTIINDETIRKYHIDFMEFFQE